MNSKPSIGIVGGAGFVGLSLATHLSRKFTVTVLDVKSPQGFNGRFQACDVRDGDSIKSLVEGLDLIINTAIVQVPDINEKQRLGYEVNVLGIQNLCEAVETSASVKGLIHASSWHVFGEMGLKGTLKETFGYGPDKVGERAYLYALCKIAQETVIRIYAKMSEKSYGIIRLGTVLGEGMPKQTAANLFIENAIKGEPITPFKETQYRPMLYVDIRDVCRGFEALGDRFIRQRSPCPKPEIINLVSSAPITIIEMARIIQSTVTRLTRGEKKPKIKVLDRGGKSVFDRENNALKVDNRRAQELLAPRKLIRPMESIEDIVSNRLGHGSLPKRKSHNLVKSR